MSHIIRLLNQIYKSILDIDFLVKSKFLFLKEEDEIMQCGSTGLGNMALKMRMEDESKMTKLPPTRPPEGSLIMYCKTYDPVIWCVWIGIEPEDMGSLLRLFFKKETMAFVFKSLFRVMASKCRGLLYRKKSTEEVVEVEAKEKNTK